MNRTTLSSIRGLVVATLLVSTVGCAEEVERATADEASDVTPLSQAGTSRDQRFCEVQAIMSKNCIPCHDGKGTGGSPMGLTKYADFHAQSPLTKGKKVYETVALRMHNQARPMPPRGVLPEADLKAIDDWVAAGAPPVSCEEPPPEPGETLECDEIYTLRAHRGSSDSPYVIPANSELLAHVSFNPPWGSEKVQAIAFKPLVANPRVLHSWWLFGNGEMLNSWGPGDEGAEAYPASVGMDLPNAPGSLRLDVHYYNGSARAEEDTSGVSLCVVRGDHLRPNAAAVATELTAPGPILVPAKQSKVASGVCRVEANGPVTFVQTHPHANKLARRMHFTVQKPNGQTIVMHDEPFRFGEQGTYPLRPLITVESGDLITTACTYDNPTERDVFLGPTAQDELCFNYAVYYPKGALRCVSQ